MKHQNAIMAIVFTLLESFLYLLMSVASCWDQLLSATTTIITNNNVNHIVAGSHPFENETLIDQDGLQMHRYHQALRTISAITIVMASFVSFLALALGIWKRRDDSYKNVKDHMGMAFGASVVPLACYNMMKIDWKEQHGNMYFEIMTFLLSAVGLSFALSCLWTCVIVLFDERKWGDAVMGYTKVILVHVVILLVSTMIYLANASHSLSSYHPYDYRHHYHYYWILGLITAIFTGFEMILFHLYMVHPSTAKTSTARVLSLRNVFSCGEWIAVASCIALVATHYIVSYVVPQSWTRVLEIPLFSSEMVVSEAGLLGCLIGSTINIDHLFVNHWFFWKVNQRKTEKYEGVRNAKKCVVRMGMVAVTVLICIEIALFRFCSIQGTVPGGNDVNHPLDGCCSCSGKGGTYHFRSFPISLPTIAWLFWFLRQKSRHGDSTLLWPNYTWIIYWMVVLVISTPMAIVIAKKLQIMGRPSSNKNRMDGDRKKKLTVISRKYFHLVAVILFTPPTLYAQEMMTLSYAIALSFLILLESIRLTIIGKPNTYDQKSLIKVNPHHGNSLTLNDFFDSFLDEKDWSAAQNGSFVFTHMALVIGCGLPLWLLQLSRLFARTCDDKGIIEMDDTIIPFLGIIVLGIGDAAGAVVGSWFGKHPWPHSRKTMEGSLAMLLSMLVSSLVLRQIFLSKQGSFDLNSILYEMMFVYFPVTMLEASTLQIDNLSLTLVAFSLKKIMMRSL